MTYAGKPCRRGHDGLRYESNRTCVECVRVARAKYYAENREKMRAYFAAWRAANPEKVRTSCATWSAANPEKARAASAAWRVANPGRERARGVAWTNANREKVRAWNVAWQRANPEAVAARGARRRARKLNAPGRGVTAAEWEECLTESLGICAYCNERKPLSMDHLDPLFRGGSHDPSNIAAACTPCNSSKRDTPLLLWLATL